MNGEIPSVPITTLAGIASLTDLLPEMPLPSPLPLSNKSLLFHPRVAEEAQNLLSVRDESLVPQLIQSLSQTSSQHIELKDHYAGTEPPVEQQQNIPELLKAILHRNPNVFKGPPANVSVPPWNQNFNCNDSSPASYSQGSPNLSYSSPAPGYLPQDPVPGPVPGPVPVPIPPPDPGPQQRVSVITEQYKTPSVINNCEPVDKSSVVLVKEEPVVTQAPPRSGGVQGDLPNSTQESSSIPRTNAMHIAGSSPAQASTAPVTQEQEKSKLLSGRQSRRTTSVNLDAKASGEASSSISATVQIPEIMKLKEMKEPVVRLNRLSEEDQALMQKSLKAYAEKNPSLANKLGIVATPSSNHRSAHNSTSYKEDSGSDSDEPLQKSKYFKSRDREREVKRQKDKDDRKKARANISDDDDYVPDDDSTPQSGRKRRHGNSNESGNQVDDFVPKTKLRKVERKVASAAEKLSVEELMETNTYQRFIRSIELIFDNTEDLDLNTEMDDNMDVPAEALIPKYQLQELCSEAAKLKNLSAMEAIPADRLVRLLNVLEKNIRDGVRVCPLADPDEDEEESKLWLELAMERVMRAVDASLTSMYILTSPNMPKRIYLEDVIDRVVVFCKFQLVNTIYPSFDPVYRVETKAKAKSSSKDDHSGSGRKKRQSHGGVVKDKSIQTLYNKIHELVGLLSELLNIQVLTDTAVLHASTLGVAPFFVEGVNELQLSALRLVTSIFTKYDKHRRLLLDDILASIARLPSSKRSLRTYRLSSDEHIQMLTALVLQLIQCVVVLPEKLQDQLNLKVKEELQAKSKQGQVKEEEKKEEIVSNLDRDVLIVGKYDTAMRTAANFLSVFLNKCGNKSEEIDYRPLFENFVQDLLTTVNKPEWPAAELLLSLLGTLLVNNFVNKGTDMALRVASLDYLGVVAARLRKDAVQSQLKVDHIDQIIREIKAEESKEEESSGKSVKQGKEDNLDEEEERTQFLQRVLLDYLAVNGHNDQALIFARHFYLAQWYKDTSIDKKKSPSKSPSKKKNRRKKRKDASSEEESDPTSDDDDDDKEDARLNDNVLNNSEKFRIIEHRKNFLVGKIRPFQDYVSSGSRQQVMQTYLDYTSAELITRFLASKRPFSHSFDVYLKQILRVLTESSIAIRTKAMKCLTMVVEADPGVLGRLDMQLGVRHSFLDHSTSVREAAVDLVGKFVLSRPELIDTYYEMLSVRILDTGVSVRKRVIKILKDICIECPDFPKIPEICVKMIRRVNDEEGIRKLVMEVFQNMWFTPVRERPTLDTQSLIRKVMNITDVVATSREIGMEWFEQLLVSLFRPREDKDDSTKVHAEPPKALLTACKQIVDCLIENVLRLEESNSQNKGSNQRLVACLTTLNLFAKIRPQLLVNHAITLQPYLSLKCQTQGDYQIISSVARTLELVVPLMEHPSETFLAQLEEDSVKLILLHDRSVVASCLSCLGSIVNNVTRNFKLIRDCFNKYYGILRDAKEKETFVRHPTSNQYRPLVRRALFTVGLLLRHFDFTDKDVIEGLDADIKNQVFETLMYFVGLSDKDIQFYTLRAIGSLCIRHYEFMLQTELKSLYHNLLTTNEAPVPMRVQVLNNIEMYLEEEEQRMIRQDQEWAKMSKRENLKEMGDVTSGMASTVIQLYLKEILEAFLHPDVGVRHAALKVIQLILAQGLVHPVQIVPYLICMSTDMEKVVSHSADKQLQDIEKKYPGFIHMKSQLGIRLSFKLHCILQQDPKGEPVPVRGFRHVEGEPLPTALNGFLYSILRSTKQQRRALVLSVLKQFDEQAKTSLSQMLYYADNLAYFPFQVQDEPLFIIHHVDIMISVTGTNLMQTFREALIPLNNQEQRLNLETGQPELVPAIEPDEDEDEDPEVLFARVPADTSVLQDIITSFQGCLLLLVLKQHLKDLYGFTDAKITQYSPSEAAKVYEKAVNRRSNAIFNPKATLAKLKENPPDILDDKQRRALITQYLDFKQMMLKFDPDDAEEEEDGSPSKANISHAAAGAAMPPPGASPYPHGVVPPITLTINTSHGANSPDKVRINNIQNDGTPQRVPKLTIVAPKRSEIKERHHRKSHKSDKHKKHRHKKKRKKYGDESDDDSEEFSDPDFLA